MYDREGTKIKAGDIVEFYYGADYAGNGTASPVETDEAPTRMVDLVIEDHRGRMVFVCPGTGGAWAERYNGVCKVIGHMPEDRKLFGEFVTDEELDPTNYGFEGLCKEMGLPAPERRKE